MPELFETNEMWVNDADDMFADDNAFDKEIPITIVEETEPTPAGWITERELRRLDNSDIYPEDIYVEEDGVEEEKGQEFSVVNIPVSDFTEAEEPMVVSEDEIIPGSDKILVEENEDDARDKEPVKEKDWQSDKDHAKFIAYIVDKKNKIPKHSGETIPGCERAKSFLKAIDNEISQAMRTDLDGTIDEQQIDIIRKDIEKMVDRLDRQISKLKKKVKKADLNVRLVSEGQCEKCNSIAPMWHDVNSDKEICMRCEAEADKEENIEKTASTPIINVYVSAFERAIVGTIINAAISGGKNIETVYEKLKEKYSFTPREELAIQQIISDSGYALGIKDRGAINEPKDPSSGDNIELQTQYYA